MKSGFLVGFLCRSPHMQKKTGICSQLGIKSVLKWQLWQRLFTGPVRRQAGSRFATAAGLFAVALAVPAFAQEDAGKIIAKVRSTYEGLQSLTADFEKDYTWALAGETQTLTGKLFLKKGDRYRIETDLQTIVTDGKTVWTYSPEKAQVFIDRMEKSEENPLPRDLLVKYTSEFKPQYLHGETVNGRDCHVVQLNARDEEAYARSVTVWVDKKSSVAVQIEQRDLNDNITIYRLKNFSLNLPLNDQLFTFAVPEKTEVIDWR